MRDKTFQALLDRKAELLTASRAIIDGATDGEFTAEARAELDGNTARLDAVLADLARLEAVREAERQTLGAARPVISDVRDRASEKFKSAGEQMLAIVAASTPGGHTDPRLTYQAAATGLNRVEGGDGGFLLQPEFSSVIFQRMYSVGQILGRCRRIPLGANTGKITIPAVDETSRANGSRFGGVRAYWRAEGDTVTASQPKFANVTLEPDGLMAIVYATKELMRDATALDAWMRETVPQELTFVAEDAVLNGTGVGQPLGILNSPALVSVTKEAGQTAASLQTENLVKMRARHWGRQNAVWTYNVDIEPQLLTVAIQVGVGGSTAYMPAGGISGAAFDTLWGRPLVETEYNATLGTVGDIVLADFSQYAIATRGEVETAESMHVRFIYGENTFRFTYEIDGQPLWKSALTPFKGSATRSPFVALATRS